jgi:hypothetical protein
MEVWLLINREREVQVQGVFLTAEAARASTTHSWHFDNFEGWVGTGEFLSDRLHLERWDVTGTETEGT